MGFFHLVKQHHLIGTATHRFGQSTAFFVTDIAGRRTNKPGDRVFFHIFGHINPAYGGFIIKQKLGQRLGQFGLADTGRAKKQETANRPRRVLQTGARATHGTRHGFNGSILPNHPAVQIIFHSQQFFALTGQHFFDRHTGPARDNGGNMVFRYRFFQHGLVALMRCLLGFSQLIFQRRNNAIGQFTGAFQFTAPLHLFQLQPRRLKLFLDFLAAGQPVFFALPARRQTGDFFLQPGQFALQLDQPVGRGFVGFLFQRLALNFQLHNAPVKLVQFFRLAVNLHPQAAGRLIDQINRLIGQKPVSDIAL